MRLTITNTNNQGSLYLSTKTTSGRLSMYVTPVSASTYSYNSAVLLSWPSSGSEYTLYTGAITSNDDGYTSTPITLPVAFSTNNQSSTNLYVSTNGYFTLTSGAGSILSGPTVASPATMAANPADLWLQKGLVMSDGDAQNVYYQTSTDGIKSYVKLLVYAGTYQATTTPKSWIANFYRDSTYEWLEVRAKSNAVGNAGPYNAVSVASPSSTTSKVWRGDLTGRNWVYMGTGSVQP